MPKKTFKEKWEEVDSKCSFCDQVTERAVGMNKQNLKRLFFSKPSLQDGIVLFLIIMTLLLAWRYQVETQECRNTIENIEEICREYNNPSGGSGDIYGVNDKEEVDYNFQNLNVLKNEKE